MTKVEYSIAAAETLEVLKNFNTSDVEKIPKKFMNFLNQIKDPNHKVFLDFTKPLDELNITNNTKAILAMIYRNYWCTEEERKEYDKILARNSEKKEKELLEKYNPDNLFKKKEVDFEEISEDKQLVKVEKQNIFKIILTKIMNIFKKGEI